MSAEDRLLGLGLIAGLGVSGQWLAWRLQVPSILLLLGLGFLAGPVLGLLQPDALFGDLLFPIVSLSVGLILFEGGLSLRLGDLRHIGGSLWNLVTLGALVTWALATWAAQTLLDMPLSTALLLGSILVVTGPTVVGPLLRHVRPVGKVAAVAHWEGIVIDPVGAVLAVLVFEAIGAAHADSFVQAARGVVLPLVETAVIGTVIGGLAAFAALQALRRYWVPDYLQNPVLLMAVSSAFVLSNLVREESGLFTVTLMGVLLANQRAVPVQHIVEFKENLRVLLIASLFILLAARVSFAEFRELGWRGLVFVGFLIVVVRPLAVLVSTLGSSLNLRERAFLAWLAPRGIVAASVASVFALRLGDAGRGLVPATFLVIALSVAVYGLTLPFVARRLRLSNPSPQGVLFVGAHPAARAIAKAVKGAGFPVLLVDNNAGHVSAARLEGLPTAFTSILSEHALNLLDQSGLGRLVAMTSDDEVNALATLHFREVFGRAELYQLPPRRAGSRRTDTAPAHLRGRYLFGPDTNYDALEARFARGEVAKATRLSAEFDYEDFRGKYGEAALPLFLVTETELLRVVVAGESLAPKPGQLLISLVDPARAKLSQETKAPAEPAQE